MGQAAAPLAIVSSVASGVGSIMSGRARAQSYAAEARQREFEAKQYDLQASQISAQRAQELGANLSAIEAVRAGRNLAPGSPTERVLLKSFEGESDQTRMNETAQARLGALSMRNAAAADQASGKAAMIGGYLGAVGDFAQAGIRLKRKAF